MTLRLKRPYVVVSPSFRTLFRLAYSMPEDEIEFHEATLGG